MGLHILFEQYGDAILFFFFVTANSHPFFGDT
jgi:hypothetical protein